MAHRVGLLVGPSRGFVEALEQHLTAEPAISCERVMVEAPGERHISRYDALLDRASEHVPHLSAFARTAAMAGTAVVNDPFVVRDAFAALSRAARLGMPTARAALLPQKTYRSDVDCERGLSNLAFPLRWQQLADYVGLPARLCDVELGGEGERVESVADLLSAYDQSGERVMMLRQELEGSHVRVVCVGEQALVVPLAGRSLDAARSEALCSRALGLSRALRLVINAVDFVVSDHSEAVISADQRYPTLEPGSLSDGVFEAAVTAAAALMVRAARNPTDGLFAQRP